MSVRGSGAEKAGVLVVVPTTAGVIEIMGLRWSPKIPSSRVVLGNETADQCERWTKEYNSLLRAGDPMRTLMGLHESGGYRLVVSAEIDHGRSWMMPVSAGHFAAARGEALHNDPSRARLMIWTTGAIDYSQPETARDAKVVENDYHLISKIDHSRALFAAAAHAGMPVLCVLPKGPDAEKAAAILGKVLGQQPHHVAIADSLAELIAPIEGFLKAGDFQALPENAQPLTLYVAPQERADRTAAEEAPTPPGAEAPPPPPPGSAPLGSAPLAGAAPPPPYAGTGTTARGGLPVGALVGVGLVTAAIGLAYLALVGFGGGTPKATVASLPASTPAQPQQSQPAATTQPSATQPPIRPATTQPATTQPAAQPQAAQPQPAQTQPAQPQPGQTASAQPQTTAQPQQPAQPATAPVAKLTLLTAPAGSSCQAQIYQLPPRYQETTIDVPGEMPVFEIDGANLCGVAVSGATFQRGTGSATVQSLSSPTRVVFAQAGQPVAPPALSLSGGSRIELKLR
jgi:hypothetical protein